VDRDLEEAIAAKQPSLPARDRGGKTGLLGPLGRDRDLACLCCPVCGPLANYRDSSAPVDGVSLLSGGMTEFAAMTTALVEELVPDQLWQLVAPLLPLPPALRTAAGDAPYPIATAPLRSSTWPAPPPRGGCYPPRSWAAAHLRPCGVAWVRGPGLACSTPSTWRCWTGSASRAGWTGRGPAWTP